MKNSVSVIVVSWNRKSELRECLESIKQQTFPPDEIIVVDNHSSDGSPEMVRREFPDVKLIPLSSNHGSGEGRNQGIIYSSGEFVAMVDSDVTLPRDWVEKVIGRFKKGPQNIGLITTNVKFGAEFVDGFEEYYSANFTGGSCIAKREALDKTNYFPKEYFIYNEEMDLAAQMINAGYKILYYPGTYSYHKFSKAGRSALQTRCYLSLRNHLWTIWKYYDKKHLIIFTMVSLVSSLILAIKEKTLKSYFKGVIDAILGIPYCLKNRQVVKNMIYKPLHFRGVVKKGWSKLWK